jgi:hypothetical protein
LHRKHNHVKKHTSHRNQTNIYIPSYPHSYPIFPIHPLPELFFFFVTCALYNSLFFSVQPSFFTTFFQNAPPSPQYKKNNNNNNNKRNQKPCSRASIRMKFSPQKPPCPYVHTNTQKKPKKTRTRALADTPRTAVPRRTSSPADPPYMPDKGSERSDQSSDSSAHLRHNCVFFMVFYVKMMFFYVKMMFFYVKMMVFYVKIMFFYVKTAGFLMRNRTESAERRKKARKKNSEKKKKTAGNSEKKQWGSSGPVSNET